MVNHFCPRDIGNSNQSTWLCIFSDSYLASRVDLMYVSRPFLLGLLSTNVEKRDRAFRITARALLFLSQSSGLPRVASTSRRVVSSQNNSSPSNRWDEWVKGKEKEQFKTRKLGFLDSACSNYWGGANWKLRSPYGLVAIIRDYKGVFVSWTEFCSMNQSLHLKVCWHYLTWASLSRLMACPQLASCRESLARFFKMDASVNLSSNALVERWASFNSSLAAWLYP